MGLGNPIRSYLGLLLFNGGGEATWLPPYMDRDNHRKAPSLEAYKLHSSNWLLVLPALIGKKRTICEITNQQHIRKHIPTRCVGLKLVTHKWMRFLTEQSLDQTHSDHFWPSHIIQIYYPPFSWIYPMILGAVVKLINDVISPILSSPQMVSTHQKPRFSAGSIHFGGESVRDTWHVQT